MINLFVFILSLMLQSDTIRIQDPSYSNKGNIQKDLNVDSGIKELEKINRKFDSHKNNKDSAWINDLNGHLIWDSRSKSKDGKAITLLDSITNNYYILDTSHTIICAYNSLDHMLWKTNPRKDSSLPDYRHKNPIISFFKLGKLSSDSWDGHKEGEMVIFICFSNSQSGFIDLKTGRFTFGGQL